MFNLRTSYVPNCISLVKIHTIGVSFRLTVCPVSRAGIVLYNISRKNAETLRVPKYVRFHSADFPIFSPLPECVSVRTAARVIITIITI